MGATTEDVRIRQYDAVFRTSFRTVRPQISPNFDGTADFTDQTDVKVTKQRAARIPTGATVQVYVEWESADSYVQQKVDAIGGCRKTFLLGTLTVAHGCGFENRLAQLNNVKSHRSFGCWIGFEAR